MKNISGVTLALSVLWLVGTAALPVHAADTCADKLKTVKAEMDKTADGAKREAAEEHYKLAEDAMKAKDEEGCVMHLGMAKGVLK